MQNSLSANLSAGCFLLSYRARLIFPVLHLPFPYYFIWDELEVTDIML